MPNTAQSPSSQTLFCPRQPSLLNPYAKARPFDHAKGGRASGGVNKAGYIFSSGSVAQGLPADSIMADQRPLRGVVQEKGLLTQALKSSGQPGAVANGQSPESVCSNCHRSQSRYMSKVKLVHSTIWLDPRVRAEMERIARAEGITFSEVGARACAAWVRYTIQHQQEALFEPRLRHMMREEIQALGERIVFFEMRNAFASEQTRILTIDLYKRQLKHEGVSQERFYELLDDSDKMAQKNITQHSPKFKTMLAERKEDTAN
jgi:hypothetical protein